MLRVFTLVCSILLLGAPGALCQDIGGVVNAALNGTTIAGTNTTLGDVVGMIPSTGDEPLVVETSTERFEECNAIDESGVKVNACIITVWDACAAVAKVNITLDGGLAVSTEQDPTTLKTLDICVKDEDIDAYDIPVPGVSNARVCLSTSSLEKANGVWTWCPAIFVRGTVGIGFVSQDFEFPVTVECVGLKDNCPLSVLSSSGRLVPPFVIVPITTLLLALLAALW
eukprot:GFYU01007609.1.p1 GENE.GFYU01007609.1~~GFYU01007609.1.p1  ORF type:complete len:227 (-),score=29.30 GFYU01007609.1:178-858(-)